jgi:hypothetical protein
VAHGNLEVELLTAKVGDRLQRVEFAWPRDTAPLSWHLTEAEKRELQTAFDSSELLEPKRRVCEFLAGSDVTFQHKCHEQFPAKSK